MSDWCSTPRSKEDLHIITTDAWLDTSSVNHMNEYFLNIFGSSAQIESGLTLQRKKESIEIAKKEVEFKGRKLEVSADSMKYFREI